MKRMHAEVVKATLTDLRRNTAKVVRPVMAGHGKVTIIERGHAYLEIVPVPRIDRKTALAALQAIGPVEFRPRK